MSLLYVSCPIELGGVPKLHSYLDGIYSCFAYSCVREVFVRLFFESMPFVEEFEVTFGRTRPLGVYEMECQRTYMNGSIFRFFGTGIAEAC